jgi:peptidoglycan/xylan/chitin deacetylase (PgdA/CDA1 family)
MAEPPLRHRGWSLRAPRSLCALLLVLAGLGAFLAPGRGATTAAQSVGIRVPILSYHAIDYSYSGYSVTPEQLDAQCAWLLTHGYTVITLWQFWDAAFGAGTLPPNPVVFTDDDGWSSATTFAEVLGRYGLTATYFVNNVSPLTPDQIASLAQHGSVQAHTVTHAHLAGLDYDSQVAEIAQNMTYLQQITGQPMSFLAWPFAEWDDSAVQAAQATGIIGAFGLGGDAAQIGALDPFHVPRIMILSDDDVSTFAAKVTNS